MKGLKIEPFYYIILLLRSTKGDMRPEPNLTKSLLQFSNFIPRSQFSFRDLRRKKGQTDGINIGSGIIRKIRWLLWMSSKPSPPWNPSTSNHRVSPRPPVKKATKHHALPPLSVRGPGAVFSAVQRRVPRPRKAQVPRRRMQRCP